MKFLKDFGKHRHFQVLMSWIKKIGNDTAAANYYFRQEREAHALPPPTDTSHKNCTLRWYCLRLSPSAVILFYGGEKTTQKAQECPNVGPYFEDANVLSRIIWKDIDEKEITFDQSDRLIVPNDYKINL